MVQLPGNRAHRIIAHVALVFCVFVSAGSLFAQLPSQDPGSKQKSEFDGVKYSVPKGFNLKPDADSNVAFMRHDKYNLGVFVAVPKRVDDEYLATLSNTLVSKLFPEEKEFKWKLLPANSDQKVSRFQTATGGTKGFNQKRLFLIDYITVEVNERAIMVGYITQLGESAKEANRLFGGEGFTGMSMPGWYAQAHVLASITGEKYEQINPGTVIRGEPVK